MHLVPRQEGLIHPLLDAQFSTRPSMSACLSYMSAVQVVNGATPLAGLGIEVLTYIQYRKFGSYACIVK